jgi:hypothetical protein
MKPVLIALACGWGQQPMLDAYGNSTCVQAQTGEVRKVEGSLADCPTGMIPLLTPQGPACVQKDTAQHYFNQTGSCPNGTARGLDRYGNRTCVVPR